MEIVFICAAFLALLLLRVGDAALLGHRRRNWHRVQGRVLTMRYVAYGENVYPTAVVCCLSDSGRTVQKNVGLPGVDFDGGRSRKRSQAPFEGSVAKLFTGFATSIVGVDPGLR